jgi:tetratricopeptide (TPR) repeat protein
MKKTKEIFYPKLLCISICLLVSDFISAQVLTPHQPENKWLVLAEEQFQQGHYTSSAQSAEKYINFICNNVNYKNTAALEKAEYLKTVSYLYTNKPGSADSAERFINGIVSAPYKQRTAFALAQNYFRNNKFANAIPYYNLAGIANLSNREIANEKFEMAYCYFNIRQFDKAEPLLASIKELEGKYYIPGNYYYGLLAYNQGNYADALKSFNRIENEKEYRDIVPYYVAEIHYFMGEKEKALQDALRLIKRKDKMYYDNELYLLAAQVLFEQQNYKEALPYFEHYYQNTSKIRKEELYEMAYCYYKTEQWNNAIEKFKPLSSTRDSLGQTAMYLLGDCYLKTGDKKSARNAFSICADMNFNPGQQEASLLLAAKLSYEMGYNDEALGRIRELIAAFPKSAYNDEAKTLLSELLIKTNNYEEAYKALQDVTSKDTEYWNVYQKVTYGYAMQQLQSGNTVFADSLLSLSLQHPIDHNYEAAANFWKGDIAYKANRFPDTRNYMQAYISAGNFKQVQRISADATAANAYFDMGYAAMQMQDYKAAGEYFNRAHQSQTANQSLTANATVHEADALFMQKDLVRAYNLYDEVIAGGGPDADYARFQKAIILGLTGRNNEKISLLQSLITKNSTYASDARYEMALVYIEDDKYQAAINTLQPLTGTYDHTDMAPKAWMKIGFAYQQLNNNDKAIEAYRHVVTEYPTSEDRPLALDALKSMYLQNNNPGAYAQLLKENNLASSDNSLDSAYYLAAEGQFALGKWESAKQALTQYLKDYPNGVFSNKAHYYKAESHMRLNEFNEAAAEYEEVLKNPWNDFSENSARHAAVLAYQNKRYYPAYGYYNMLRNNAMGQENLQQAYMGLMQTTYYMNQFAAAAKYADTLLTLPGLDENTTNEVLYYKARALQQDNKPDEALPIYRQLENSKTPSVATEARYYIATYYFRQNQLKEAEAVANKTIQSGGSDYYVIKSYLLIADIFTIQKDYFNAKATLQSIIKNSKIAELKEEAEKKLEEVKSEEQKQSKLSE